MKFIVNIEIMPNKELLDPQGKAVTLGLKNLGLNTVENVRIGKHISFEIEAENASKAKEAAEIACKKLLANPIMESFTIQVG
jgi:phosphoribosylformylglycinamidine synthase subunit PurS